jgi:hypothetical protein
MISDKPISFRVKALKENNAELALKFQHINHAS